jgi:hypothetical protein
MTDVCHLPAHELVRLMSSQTVSCPEVIEAHLVRIDAVNPALNALVKAVDPDSCLKAADQADGRAAREGANPTTISTAAPTIPTIWRGLQAAASASCVTTPASPGSSPRTAESRGPAAFSAMRWACSARSTATDRWLEQSRTYTWVCRS